MSSSSKSSSSSSTSSSKTPPSTTTTKRTKLVINPAQFKRRLDSELRYFKTHTKDASCKYKLVGVEAEHRRWSVLFLPDKEPYGVGAYRMIVDFPKEYPFRPPLLMFKTKIYHPNIGEKGNMDLSFCHPEIWKPTMRMFQICDFIISMLDYPHPTNCIVRKELAEFAFKNREAFNKEAAKFCTIHSEARP